MGEREPGTDPESGKFPKGGRLGSGKQGGDKLLTAELPLKHERTDMRTFTLP